jgi:hypothetical protein
MCGGRSLSNPWILVRIFMKDVWLLALSGFLSGLAAGARREIEDQIIDLEEDEEDEEN